MTLNITDETFSTSGVDRAFRIGSNFGVWADSQARASDNAQFYGDADSFYNMSVTPQPFQNTSLDFNHSFLEGRTTISGSGSIDETPFTNSFGTFLGRTGLYNHFHLECNASYYDSSNTLLHTYSGFIYGGIQVNGSTVSLRNIDRNNVYVSSGSLDDGNINVVNDGLGNIVLRLSSFTGAAAGSKTVWSYVGWELLSGYF